jgi:hypothetical protein
LPTSALYCLDHLARLVLVDIIDYDRRARACQMLAVSTANTATGARNNRRLTFE